MNERLQAILDEMKEHRDPDVGFDISVDFLKQFPPDEREEFVRKMVEGQLPLDLSSEEREVAVQTYLRLIENFESFLDSRSTETDQG